ncbi:hypothetical protein IKD49_02505 [Candidatus Saccharibacteria bacterium]|nr:hypothetical protein [Candidatus Saccharibacteria bacterium]
MDSDAEKKSTNGARNLFIMSLVAILIALSTTGVSLAIYHNSGDIYLDRSRPGFLPDEDEIEDDANKQKFDYELEKNGEITAEILDEYLNNYVVEEEKVQAYREPFDSKALSDAKLGIEVSEEGQQ